MSAIEKAKPVWSQYQNEQLDSKYEKCRHITEEIYKRIDITFQIKSLGTGSQSDASEQSDQIDIDSNDLSNGTDLFAYDKSDSLPSSTEGREEQGEAKCFNVNNNEVKKSAVPIYKPPRKRFRKKIKKRVPKPSARTDTEGSSDEALPLSRIVVDAKPRSDCAETVMGVPKIVILTGLGEGKERIKDTKPKPATPKAEKPQETPETKSIPPPVPAKTERVVENTQKDEKQDTASVQTKSKNDTDTISTDVINVNVKTATESKKCNMCSLSFRGERGLRRHLAITHILIPEGITRPKTRKSEAKAV